MKSNFNKLYESVVRSINPLHWDSKNGLGQVPWNEEIAYRGFIRKMSPSDFRMLVPPGSSRPSKDYLKNAILNGVAFGPPFLLTKWDENKNALQVLDHEGRSRVDVISELFPDEMIPVHIFIQGYRASNITNEMKKAPLIKQRI